MIFVYTEDYENREEVFQVYNYLRHVVGIKRENIVGYKLDNATRARKSEYQYTPKQAEHYLQPSKLQTYVSLSQAYLRPYDYEYAVEDDEDAETSIAEKFIDEHFEYHSHTHDSSIFSGSTFSNKHSEGPQIALDASVTDYILDEDGRRIGVVMITADGYNHFKEEDKNKLIGLTSAHSCEYFVNTAKNRHNNFSRENLSALYQEVGSSSKEASQKLKQLSRFPKESPFNEPEECSLTTTIVTPTEDGYKAILGNIGDSMVLIIDGKTKKIKSCLHPKKANFLGLSPVAVQRAGDRNVDFLEATVEADDIIVQLTDGMWEQLPHTRRMEGVDELGTGGYAVYYLNEEEINTIFSDILGEVSQPSFMIAKEIVSEIVKRDLSKRKTVLSSDINQLVKRYEHLIPSDDSETSTYKIADWLIKIAEQNPEDSEKLHRLIREAIKVKYKKNEGESDEEYENAINVYIETRLNAHRFISEYIPKGFGDCSTVSVMRVPNKKVELVRALIENPENSKLLQKVSQTIQPPELADIILRLQGEKHLKQPVSMLLNRELGGEIVSSYKNKQFIHVERLVSHSNKIANNLRNPQNNRFTSFITELNESEELTIKDINVLFNAFRKEMNVHHNPRLDQFLFHNNTKPWQECWETIKNNALQKLFAEVDKLEDRKAQEELLLWAKEQPLFRDHRHNHYITGAWGETNAVQQINEKLYDKKINKGFFSFLYTYNNKPNMTEKMNEQKDVIRHGIKASQ